MDFFLIGFKKKFPAIRLTIGCESSLVKKKERPTLIDQKD